MLTSLLPVPLLSTVLPFIWYLEPIGPAHAQVLSPGASRAPLLTLWLFCPAPPLIPS